MPPYFAFRPDAEASFVERPNRFVLTCRLGELTIEAHCPNPGRLSELLFPGTRVLLERRAPGGKLGWTAVAVRRGEAVVPLVSARANPAVQALVLPGLFPGAREVRPEFTLDDSRFDFAVTDARGEGHLVEVKACSEVEFGSGLFPDAPSLRAVKHLEHLAFWGDRGWTPHVVFVLVHSRADRFGPNAHTDPEFARTLKRLAPRLHLHAVTLNSDESGLTRLVDPAVPFDWTGADAPDEGLLVTWRSEDGVWRVEVGAHATGWSRAVAKAPARRSFGLRLPVSEAETLRRELGDRFHIEPHRDPEFVPTVMRWRHRLA